MTKMAHFELKLVLMFLSMVCNACAVDYLFDCGSLDNTTVGTRIFIADQYTTKFISTQQNIKANTSSKSIKVSSNLLPLYQTARIFTGTSKYTLPITQMGRFFIRLYFYPFNYGSYKMGNASFSVTAQQFVFLSDFTPQSSAVVKEFSVNVTSDTLVITFIPSDGSFAFLNALEVVSVPDSLIIDDANLISPAKGYTGLATQAFETVARVNMGGPVVDFDNDTLWRTWVPDDGFLVNNASAIDVNNVGDVNYEQGFATSYSAPVWVYGTAKEMNSKNDPNSNFNVTWEFNVEPGFQYLIRFHFCDIVSKTLDQLYFNVYYNDWIVSPDLDLSTMTGALGTPVFVDAVTPLATSNEFLVKIGPSTLANVYPNAILNGLEIMKMSNSKASLSGNGSNLFASKKATNVGVIVGASIGGLCVVLLSCFLLVCCTRRRKLNRQGNAKPWIPVPLLSLGSKYSNGTATSVDFNLGYRIPLVALQEATKYFDESLAIGIGGFGKVYKGVLSDGTKVAVKRGNPRSQQGFAEFRTEIEMLSQFRHRHLVSLIGYCDEKNEMILVYEYMENGTLKSHLYGSDHPSLSWKKRLEICIGAARGLHYLHTGYAKAVIHRDVKSANILLDENYMAKVADFGLSKAGPEVDQTHVSTAVKGSFGYLDPEYFRRQQLTEKSDVYSFGVVLFEVLCARPVIDPTLPRDMVNLTDWCLTWQKKGQIEHVVDPALSREIKPESLRKFGETAEKCLADYGVDRPTMGDVLWNLEYTLQLQDAVIVNDPADDSANMIGTLSPQVHNFSENDYSVASVQYDSSNVDDDSGVSVSKVFSQIVQTEGR